MDLKDGGSARNLLFCPNQMCKAAQGFCHCNDESEGRGGGGGHRFTLVLLTGKVHRVFHECSLVQFLRQPSTALQKNHLTASPATQSRRVCKMQLFQNIKLVLINKNSLIKKWAYFIGLQSSTFILALMRLLKISSCSLERKGKRERDRVRVRLGACRQKYGLNPLAVYPITLLSASNPLDSIPFC